jgi:serine phosphatase RsbU (regulator of sigma subunit)
MPPPAVEPVPTVFPTIEGVAMAAVFVGKRVAGDFYDALRVSTERVLFGLLDVAGRRDENRPVLTAAQKVFREQGKELFSPSDINESEAMTKLCLLVNRAIMEAENGVRSCPAFMGCYHEKFGTLCYTNAGHTPGLMRDRSGILELPSTGLPMGLFSHATCDAPTIGLGAGAVLLLVSRGVVAAHCRDCDADDLKMGLERVKERLQNSTAATAAEVCDFILEDDGSRTRSLSLLDDETALVFSRTR